MPETLAVAALPPCVLCTRARSLWNGRLPESAGGAPPARRAAFRVTVGTSQVERYECEPCQAATGNPVLLRLVAREEA